MVIMGATDFVRLLKPCSLILLSFLISEGSAKGQHDPLIITPYLKSGQAEKARELSRVRNPPFPTNVPSYSGFFTIDADHDSNIFFWFFPPQKLSFIESTEAVPLLLWLNGGPGSSSQFGLFVENGPFVVNETNIRYVRTTSWTKAAAVLFLDSPVGTGFSFTRDKYATSISQVTEGLYISLCQFFELFPNYKQAKFYITGESFAGQYIPHLAIRVLEQGMKSPLSHPSCDISLSGISIGNGFIDPENSLDYAEFLYGLGLLDEKGRLLSEQWQEKIRSLIQKERYTEAFKLYDQYIGYSGLKGSLISNLTGSDFYYNVLKAKRPPDYDYYTKFVEQPKVRDALHVGSQHHFQDGVLVMSKMEGEIMKSSKTQFRKLVTEYTNIPVLLYNGQLDLIVANRLTDSFLEALNLDEIGPWSTRKALKISLSEIVGYYKTWKNLTRVTVRNCGHMVPYDKPEWGYFLITAFLKGDLGITENDRNTVTGAKKFIIKNSIYSARNKTFEKIKY
ncbi:venom serine carboxypeptidase [Folsomia candida]|nr:venom serine carboxypeptidase [Folsomia candida]